MRFQALALGAFVAAGLCAPHVARAQTMPTVEAKRDWQIGVRAEAYYDNNLSRSNKAIADTRDIVPEDYVVVPSATISLVQPFGRQAAFLKGDAGYTFHRYNTQMNRRRGKVNGGFAAVLGPCRQVTFGGYEAAQSDLANLDIGTSSNLRKTSIVGAGLQCARGVGPGGSVTVQRADVKNSAQSVRESDTTTESMSTSLVYARPSLGSFTAGFSYSNTEFPNRIIPGRPVGDGFFSQAYFLGYSRQFGSRLSVSGQGGISHVKREFAPAGVDQSFSAKNYALDVIYGFGERIDLELHAAQAITPSQQVGKTFDKQTSANASIRYQAQRFTFSTGYSWQNIDSNVDTAASLLVVTNAEVNAVFGTVSFAPNDKMSLQLNVRYEDRQANLPQFTYTATRIGLSAQASF